MLENFKEIVEALESSNESVLSHGVNDTLRLLTALSVILLPQTLITGLFGMNVLFPGEGTSAAFWWISGTMLLITVALVAWFRRRGWL